MLLTGPAKMVLDLMRGPEAVSSKPQASSLTANKGYCRMDLERINYGQ